MAAPALTIQQVHWRTLLRSRGEDVTYRVTDSYSIENLKVVVTRPVEGQVEIEEAFAVESKQWDVLIDPDTLVDDQGKRIVPSAGHSIAREDGTVYNVENTGSNRNAWRWSDALETWRRVHTVCEREN